jgi:hypothetical protein
MKYLFLILILLVIVVGCASPPKPVLNGEGPLALKIDTDNVSTPEFHNPLDFWKKHHMQSVNSGEFTEAECLSCHQVEKSCNNCHNYVGVKLVSAVIDTSFVPGQDRFRALVNQSKVKEN